MCGRGSTSEEAMPWTQPTTLHPTTLSYVCTSRHTEVLAGASLPVPELSDVTAISSREHTVSLRHFTAVLVVMPRGARGRQGCCRVSPPSCEQVLCLPGGATEAVPHSDSELGGMFEP